MLKSHAICGFVSIKLNAIFVDNHTDVIIFTEIPPLALDLLIDGRTEMIPFQTIGVLKNERGRISDPP